MELDDVEWQGCFYGTTLMNKEQAMEYSKGWHDAMENITYTAVGSLLLCSSFDEDF